MEENVEREQSSQQGMSIKGAQNAGIASFVLGLLGLLSDFLGITGFLGFIFGVIGWVLGAKARKVLPPDARLLATLGWIFSIIAVLGGLIGLFGLFMLGGSLFFR